MKIDSRSPKEPTFTLEWTAERKKPTIIIKLDIGEKASSLQQTYRGLLRLFTTNDVRFVI